MCQSNEAFDVVRYESSDRPTYKVELGVDPLENSGVRAEEYKCFTLKLRDPTPSQFDCKASVQYSLSDSY